MIIVCAPSLSGLTAGSTAIAAGAAPSPAAAIALYSQKQYAQSADMFEQIIPRQTPSPALYYYAALANRACGRESRAQQLFKYIASNFPRTTQGALSAQACGAATARQTTASAASAARTVQSAVSATRAPSSTTTTAPPTSSRPSTATSSGHVDGMVQVFTVYDDKSPSQAKILFIGNSFTTSNNMPGIIAIAFGQTTPMKITVVASGNASSVTAGGFTLEDHWLDGKAMNELKNFGPWDYVVIQDSSGRPITESAISTDWLNKFDEEVRKAKAKTILYETWADLNEQRFQDRINQTYRASASATHSALAPVGEAWQAVMQTHPEINLYWEDTHHPNAAGSYLAACVLYAKIFGKNPNCAAAVQGVSNADAQALQKQAWSSVQSSN